MAELSFLLEYAGVPFLTDRGESAPHNTPPDEAPVPVNNWLSHKEFYDELCSLIPLEALKEFYPPFPYQGRNLSALDGQDRQFDGKADVGKWFYPTGACRWGVFHGLAMSSMVKEMTRLTNGGDDPATFTMKAVPTLPVQPDSAYTVQTSMYMLPPRTISENYGGEGVFLVTLVDERYYWQGSPVTIHPTTSTTWADLLSSLATALGIGTLTYSTIETVYGKPEPDSQLWVNAESASFLLDTVAHNLGRMVVRNLDGTYALKTWAESQAQVVANRGPSLRVIRHAGGDIFASGSALTAGSLVKARNAVVPENVTVTFPLYVNGDDPVPHYLNSRYATPRPTCWYEESFGSVHSISVPISSGGPNVSGLNGNGSQYIHSAAKGLISGEAQTTPFNSSGLTALALQIARNHYDSQVVPTLDETYPGTLKWTPEGCHDIHWTYSERMRKAVCRVVRSEWNLSFRDTQHGTPIPVSEVSGVRGVGGPSVAQTVRDSAAGIAYGVNLLTFGNAFSVVPSFTSGGISEATINVSLVSGNNFFSGTTLFGAINFASGSTVNFNNSTVNYQSGTNLNFHSGTTITQLGNVVYETTDGLLTFNNPNIVVNSGSIVYNSGHTTTYNNSFITYNSGARITYASGSQIQSGSSLLWQFTTNVYNHLTTTVNGGTTTYQSGPAGVPTITYNDLNLTVNGGVTTYQSGPTGPSSITYQNSTITVNGGTTTYQSGPGGVPSITYQNPTITTNGGTIAYRSGPGGPPSISYTSPTITYDSATITLRSGPTGAPSITQTGGTATYNGDAAVTIASGASLTLASGATLNLNGQSITASVYVDGLVSGSLTIGSGQVAEGEAVIFAHSGTKAIHGSLSIRQRGANNSTWLISLGNIYGGSGTLQGTIAASGNFADFNGVANFNFDAWPSTANFSTPFNNFVIQGYSNTSGNTVDYDIRYSITSG